MTRNRPGTKGYRALVFTLLATFCALVSFARPIEADAETAIRSERSRIGLGILAGYGLFSNSFFGNGVAFGATFTYGLGRNIAVELAGLYLSESNDPDPKTVSQGRLTTIPLQLSLLGRLPLGKKLTPYVLAGVSYFLNRFNLDDTVDQSWHDLGFSRKEEVDSAVGFHVGAGLEYVIGKDLSAGFGVRYLLGKADGEWSITDDQSAVEAAGTFSGLDLNTLVFSAGLKYFLR